MDKERKRPAKHYSTLVETNKNGPTTAAERLLPGEEEEQKNYNIKEPKYAEKIKETDADEQVLVNFRMSRRRKEILEVWFRREKDQNFSAGMRAIVDEFMHKHDII